MIAAMPGANRYFCGRVHRRPLLIRLFDWWGWHQELYRVRGEMRVRRRWVVHYIPGRSIYTCRKPMMHWRAVLKPQGTRWVNMVHDRDFSQPGLDAAKGIKNVETPYWRSKIQKPTRETTRVEIPTESWELGHRYEFTRWQEE